MRYHPPHLHNQLDVQRLAQLLAAGSSSSSSSSTSRAGRASAALEPRTSRVAFEPSLSACCCELPPWNVSHADPLWTVSMWANLCRVRTPTRTREER